jgi:hypothetical protein
VIKYPKIESVKALSDMKLLVIFENCAQRIYDCRLLTDKEPFDQLQNESLFRMVQVDRGGYGIVWNDDIDLAESELWINGMST